MSFQTRGGWSASGMLAMQNGGTDFLTAAKKVMIVTAAPDGTEDFVDELSELPTQSGYGSGFAGSGRLAMTTGSFTFAKSVSSDGIAITTLTYPLTSIWTALGTPSQSIAGFCLITEATSDADSIWWGFATFSSGTFVLTGADRTLTYPSPLFQTQHGAAV